MDKLFLQKLDEGLTTVNRIADSLEKLVNEPLVQIESPPPQCPHCGKFNPEVQIDQSTAKGHIGEFVLECICGNCGKEIYGCVAVWDLQGTRTGAIQVGTQIAERANNARANNA